MKALPHKMKILLKNAKGSSLLRKQSSLKCKHKHYNYNLEFSAYLAHNFYTCSVCSYLYSQLVLGEVINTTKSSQSELFFFSAFLNSCFIGICIYRRVAKTETKPKKKVKEDRRWDGMGTNKEATGLDVFNTAENKDQVNVADSEVSLLFLSPLSRRFVGFS